MPPANGPVGSFAKPMLTASHKSRQLSPGLPHEYESPHGGSNAQSAAMNQQTIGIQPTQSGGVSQVAPYAAGSRSSSSQIGHHAASSILPHQMMSSSYQGSAGQSKSKSSPRGGGGPIDGQLHQPFDLTNKSQPDSSGVPSIQGGA